MRDEVSVMKANGDFEFLTCFEELPDPWLDRGKNHLLIDMVTLALCGTICEAETWADLERFSLAHRWNRANGSFPLHQPPRSESPPAHAAPSQSLERGEFFAPHAGRHFRRRRQPNSKGRPGIISVFRRLSLSILKSNTTIKDNVRGKPLNAG